MSMASYTADDWVTTAQAAAILGVRPGVITHLVKKRKVTTRRILGWEPTHPGLIADFANGDYFTAPSPRH